MKNTDNRKDVIYILKRVSTLQVDQPLYVHYNPSSKRFIGQSKGSNIETEINLGIGLHLVVGTYNNKTPAAIIIEDIDFFINHGGLPDD